MHLRTAYKKIVQNLLIFLINIKIQFEPNIRRYLNENKTGMKKKKDSLSSENWNHWFVWYQTCPIYALLSIQCL
jgi:hypothetical protein